MNKNNIVPFIGNQFPSHIRETNTLLIPFMEAYYEWMQLNGGVYDLTNSLSRLHNIDESLVKFAEEFDTEYLSNFPKDIITDKALTIKHISDLYKAKGTPNAVKLLIKMILGKESEIFYPSTQILKTSDGDWIQENSILVTIISGNIFDIVGESIKISTSILTFNSVVEKVKTTETSGVYEVYLERKLTYDITPNTIISYKNVVAQSQPTVTKYKVLSAGINFTVGQIFEIKTQGGSGTFIKVKSLTPANGIKSLQIIKFGYGYESDFISGISIQKNNSSVITQFPNLNDAISSVSDSGYLSIVDYFAQDYTEDTYVGKILSSFASDGGISSVDTASAVIEFNLGNKLKYPGYYSSTKGFLSDAIFLQDDFYYQAYSYVVKIDEVLEKYKDKVNATVHPAGLQLFGEYSINNVFKMNTTLKFVLNFFRLAFSDSVIAEEQISKILTKIVSDSVSPSDLYNITLLKTFTDSFSNSDITNISTTKSLNDVLSIIESASITFSKSLLESLSVADLLSINTTKNLNDSIFLTDSLLIGFFVDKYFTDIQTVNDSGGVMYLNYYTDPSYGSPDYFQGATTF